MNDARQFKLFLLDSIKSTEGDILDLSNDNGKDLTHLIAVAAQFDRIVNFFSINFLETDLHRRFISQKSQYFRHKKLDQNTNLVNEINILSNISLCILDCEHSFITDNTLDAIFNTLNFSGTLLLLNYNESKFSKFIQKYNDQINYGERLIKNGERENHLIIKCYNSKKDPNIIIKNNRALSIALVLKSGGIYDYNYVNKIASSIKRNTTIEYEIVCLTDNPYGINPSLVDRIVPLKHNYPKWWSKIELFRADIFGKNKVFFFDLDTVIVNNIDNILQNECDFCGLRDFYQMVTMGSGLMSWFPERAIHIYDNFVNDSHSIMNNYKFGDQEWIQFQKPNVKYFQDIFFNQIVSFKKHCLKQNIITIPEKAKIICFHGNPRPHMITDESILKHWQ